MAGNPRPIQSWEAQWRNGPPIRSSGAGRSRSWCGIPARDIARISSSSRAFHRAESVGAAHGSEIPYVFGTLSVAGRAANAPKYDSKDSAVSDQMQQYWTNFAKTGNPNGGSLPQWPKFDPAARAYMELTADGPIAREGLRRAACDLFLENVSGK